MAATNLTASPRCNHLATRNWWNQQRTSPSTHRDHDRHVAIQGSQTRRPDAWWSRQDTRGMSTHRLLPPTTTFVRPGLSFVASPAEKLVPPTSASSSNRTVTG